MSLTEEQRSYTNDPVGVSSARNETRGIGSYPWFSMHTTLYHTHVYHSQLSGEYPGQSDPRPPSLLCAHRATLILLNDPSKLARFSLHRVARLILECARRTSIFQFSTPLSRGVAEVALYCAHRATTASPWGLCEQEGHLAAPPSLIAESRRATISHSGIA